MMRPWSVVLVLVLFAASPSRGDDSRDLPKKIQGTWLAQSAELAGVPFPDDVRKSIKLVIKGHHYTVMVGEEPDRGTVTIDSSAKPKKMVIKGTDGPNKGKTMLAIYRLKGDTLEVCYDMSGKHYPKEFATKKGTQLFLATYKRQ